MAKYLFYIDTIERTGGAQRVMAVLAEHFSEKNELVIVNDYLHERNEVTTSLMKKNVHFVYLDQTIGKGKIRKNIKRLRCLKKLINKEKPDLCLSFLGGCNLRLLLCSSRFFGTKRVVSVRNDPTKEYSRNPLIRFCINAVFSRADHVVFQTKEASLYFNERIRQKSSIILNPVSDAFFRVAQPEKKYDISTFGRLDAQKNHALLIDSFAKVAFKFPKTRLYIFGIGPLQKQLEHQVRNLHLQDKVFFMGRTATPEIEMAQTKIFVLSSNYEGLPNALMEAMTAGAACISTDCPCGGPKMLITAGETGLLVPPNNVKALSDAIISLLENESLRMSLGDNSREFSKNRFDRTVVLGEWERLFLRVIEG